MRNPIKGQEYIGLTLLSHGVELVVGVYDSMVPKSLEYPYVRHRLIQDDGTEKLCGDVFEDVARAATVGVNSWMPFLLGQLGKFHLVDAAVTATVAGKGKAA